ncbi:MAG: site-2 protease family protein [Halobacteriota archaeon]
MNYGRYIKLTETKNTMHSSIQVGKLIGIPIKLHFSFIFILFVFILAFANSPSREYRVPMGLGGLGMSAPYRYFVATIAAILFFFTLLLHEMAHSYVAMKFGTKIHSITLFFFGGVAMMEELPKNPGEEWRIAIAGPIMSLIIGALFYIVYHGVNALNVAIYHDHPAAILLVVIGSFNVILAIFNLVPAFPMDGGRILRAFFAMRMSFSKATQRAVLIGKIFAFAMIIAGISKADPFSFILTGEWRYNLWLPILGLFLYMAAAEEEKATATFAALEGIKVREVMRIEGTIVPADITIEELVRTMLVEKTAEYAVVNAGGELSGYITLGAVKRTPIEQRWFLRVSDVMHHLDSFKDVVLEEEAASEALKRMLRNKTEVLAVKEEEHGRFVGLITRSDLAMYIEMLKVRV